MLKYYKSEKMEGELDTLVQSGLSPNEAKLYLILAKGGSQKASELAQKSGLQRPNAYDTLSQLEKKGLVGKAEENGVTVFTASPPSSLLSFLDEKRDSLEKLLPSLSRAFEKDEKIKVSVMYGKGGLKTILEDILELKADFCVYHGQLVIAETIPKFFAIFNEKRKRLGIKARFMLLDLPEARKRAKKVPFAQFNYMDSSTVSGGIWWIYSDRLVLFVVPENHPENPVTMLIKSRDLATAFQKNFDEAFKGS